ncbi:MAG: lycopene beta-cyclase CrtY [Pirellula sp.]|nr:lycopene beta-cyclase CrtY [Pirellula sp.]
MKFGYDYVLVGGGLQSGLIALALRHHQPEARILLVERDSHLCGNHTWSFHPMDVKASASPWVEAAVEVRWPHYRVRLHDFEKRVDLNYASISSAHFAKLVGDCFGTSSDSQKSNRLLLQTEVVALTSNKVVTSTGDVYHGRLVVDCRGPSSHPKNRFEQCGYQKFCGFEIKLESDWPLAVPTIMDDRIDQADGFRFIYSLPFESRRVLVEDTRFADNPTLDRDECLDQVRRYLAELGITDWTIVREESGVLPMPISTELTPGSTYHGASSTLAGGYAGGWFHAATGYSFPLAVSFAETIATTTPELASQAVQLLSKQHYVRSRFARFLNRLLFRLVRPTERYQIFRRFYRVLPNESISRFYSHQFTLWDAFRIVVGVPPGGLRPVRFVRSFFNKTTPTFQVESKAFETQESNESYSKEFAK